MAVQIWVGVTTGITTIGIMTGTTAETIATIQYMEAVKEDLLPHRQKVVTHLQDV
jgi:hypothetical protein